ncbi:MAG: hypothetical protein PHP64_02205 [Actinomycetota bacterium]|nr:hypothetical protein [Actinomycetota bacterium]
MFIRRNKGFVSFLVLIALAFSFFAQTSFGSSQAKGEATYRIRIADPERETVKVNLDFYANAGKTIALQPFELPADNPVVNSCAGVPYFDYEVKAAPGYSVTPPSRSHPKRWFINPIKMPPERKNADSINLTLLIINISFLALLVFMTVLLLIRIRGKKEKHDDCGS